MASKAPPMVKSNLDLKTICDALGNIATKWFKVGIQLGIPRSKLLEFKKEDDPLSAVVDYWLGGNVIGSVISWKSIVAVLRSGHIGEIGLAEEISKKYQSQEEDTETDGANFPTSQQSSTGAKVEKDPNAKLNLEGGNPLANVRGDLKVMASSRYQESDESRMSVKEIVQKYLHDHPDTNFVNREVFYPAYYRHKITQLLNCDVLYPPLLAIRDLVESEEDRDRFIDSFQQPHDQHNTLIKLIERGGEYGCMLLYIYICKTITTPGASGHSEAARILTEAAQLKQIPPPSLRHKTKSTSSSSSIEEEPQDNDNCTPSSKTHSGKADEVIPNKCLAELAMKITEWEVMAPQLELTEEDEVEIKADHQNSYRLQKIKCLRKWNNQNGNGATYRNLMSAARASDQITLIECLLALPEVGVELLSPKAHNKLVLTDKERPKESKHIDRQFSGSSGYSSVDLEHHSDKFAKVDADFSKLSEKFNHLEILLLNHLDDQDIRLQEIRNHIAVLPLHLVDEVSVPRRRARDELRTTETRDELFAVLNQHVWNFIDYHLLYHIITKYGNDKLRKCAEEFVEELERFKETTTVADFMEFWPRRQPLPKFDEITLKIDKVPQHCTMKELNNLRKDLCGKFFPPLSEFVMQFQRIRESSIRVTWSYPSHLTPQLREFLDSPKALSFFEQYQISPDYEIVENQDMVSTPLPSYMAKTDVDSPKPSLKADSGRCSPSLSPTISDTSKTVADPASTSSTDSGFPTPMSQLELEAEEIACNLTELSRRLVPLQDSAISVEFGKRLERDKRKRTDGGCYPSIALNSHGTVVEVKHQTATNLIFYRVGQIKDDVIAWGNPSSTKPPRKRYFCSGVYPRVTLNDDNTVIEIHKGALLDRCCYRVGRVDPTTAKIAWGPSNHLNVGLHPDIAINNNSNVVAIFRENVITKHLSYRMGQLSNMTNEITWVGGKTRITEVKAEVLSVDLNDNGHVVLSYQVPITNRIHYMLGKLSTPISAGKPIAWSKIKPKCNGFTPSVSINNRDQVVQIHQSLARRHLVSNVGVAWWGDNFKGIEWSSLNGTSNQHYGKGIFPSVAIDNSGRVVEAHEPRASVSKNRLHYYLGQIQRELKS